MRYRKAYMLFKHRKRYFPNNQFHAFFLFEPNPSQLCVKPTHDDITDQLYHQKSVLLYTIEVY